MASLVSFVDASDVGNRCSDSSSSWTVGQDPWPNNGEIDIIEGVNTHLTNTMTLHTSAGCPVDGTQSGSYVTHDCGPETPFNAGCGVQSDTCNSFGSGFNNVRGGVYATRWNAGGIQIWFFPRAHIPQDITDGNPKPENWGLPQANFSGSCNFDSHFKNHRIVSQANSIFYLRC